MTTQQEEKRYDRRDTTLRFVNRPDALDPMRNYYFFFTAFNGFVWPVLNTAI